MSEPPGTRDQTVELRFTWDDEADAGYLDLTDIGPGEAVTQRIVAGPRHGSGEVVLDFDAEGRLLGIEIIGHRLLPPGLASP